MNGLQLSRRKLIAGAMGSPLLLVPFGCTGSAAGSSRSFEDFMAAGHDPNDDCSRALVAAARWSAENDAVVPFSGRYRLVARKSVGLGKSGLVRVEMGGG